MNAYEAGIHSDLEAGAVDLGLVVTSSGLGFALDAPVIGQLRAAFDVLADGSTKLTSLSREGVPVSGLTDLSRVAELEVQLDAQRSQLADEQARVQSLEAFVAEHDA